MIHVLGWYNHENIGDEAYKLAFPQIFPKEVFVFSDKIKEKPNKIILGGGDVYNPTFLNILKNYKDVEKYAFSINLRKEDITTDLQQFKKIIIRNFIDTRLTNIKIQCLPDFTFVLNANKNRGKKLIQKLFKIYNADLYDNLVIINLNSYLCIREKLYARDQVTFDKLCFDLAKLMDKTPSSFILMSFGNGFPQNDRIANAMLYSACKYWKKVLLLFDKLGIQDTLDIFAAADAAITTRLHAGIFSCIGETPFIDITHHTKTQMFMNFIGKSDWSVDYWNFNYQKTESLLNDFLKEKEFHKKEIAKIHISTKKLLDQIADMEL